MKLISNVGMMLLLTLLLASCQSVPRVVIPTSPADHTKRLMEHPQFPLAAATAPEFVKETFATIRQLQREAADHGR